MSLKHTTMTFLPHPRNSLTMTSTTNDFPVPACPERRRLWPANAVFKTWFCSAVNLNYEKIFIGNIDEKE